MDKSNTALATRIGAYTALLGSVCAISGAALMNIAGADLDTALAGGDIAGYLAVAGEGRHLLVMNLTLWILMVLLMGVAATAMTTLSERRPVLARIARYSYWVGSPLVIAAYVSWLALVVQVAPDTSPEALLLAKTIGWFASRADWVATILIVGIGPTLIALAGREEWVPAWLFRWSLVTAITGLLNFIAMITGGSGLTSYGFLIIPAGVGWMIAAGIVLYRRIGTA